MPDTTRGRHKRREGITETETETETLEEVGSKDNSEMEEGGMPQHDCCGMEERDSSRRRIGMHLLLCSALLCLLSLSNFTVIAAIVLLPQCSLHPSSKLLYSLLFFSLGTFTNFNFSSAPGSFIFGLNGMFPLQPQSPTRET